MGRKRIAIVVQRYGPEVLGGSESLARSLAHMLADVYDVNVLTTCAKDYVTWKNDLAPGESMDGNVKVRRFAVDGPRNRLFNLYNALMLKVPHAKWMEELWMRMQGPYSSDLLNYINSTSNGYHAYIFMTYMYGTTYYCSRMVSDRSILIPTAHDEPYLRFGIYRDIFTRVRSVICLTEAEKVLVENVFGLPSGRCSVIGVPIGECSGDPWQAVKKYGISGTYLAYVGRIDVMKGVDVLVDYFNRYVSERTYDLGLVLCGTGPLDVPVSDRIYRLGFIPEADKNGILRAALASVLPSRYESYSISAMESLACGIPIIVNGHSEVLKGHCVSSGAGACYTSYDEFAGAIDRLLADLANRKTLGDKGRAYVKDHYATEVIRGKYLSLIGSIVDDSPISSPS